MNGISSGVEERATDETTPSRAPSSLVSPMELFVSGEATGDPSVPGDASVSPFTESFATLSEDELEARVFDDLVAELEDDEFADAVEALVNEGAGRHINSVATWGSSAEAPALADDEVEQWMESILSEAEHVLDEIDAEYGHRPLEWFSDETLERLFEGELGGALSAQELFFGSLKKKFKKVVKGVKNVVKKGVKIAGKVISMLNPISRVIAALKKALRPLLRRLLRRAIGKLPRPLRPVARKLARRLGVAEAEAAVISEAEAFDLEVVEYLLAPDEAAGALEAEADDEPAPGSEVAGLDEARARLARQLAEMPEGDTPLAEMEQFVPAVLAARPLIKLGISIIGRRKVVNKLAGIMARFMRRLVGRSAARQLSRHLADQGLRLLGFEAEADGAADTLGTEALVAAAEATIDRIADLDPETFEDDQALEAEIQEAFAEAAAEHVPGEFLRPDVAEETSAGARGIWVMMPRTTSPVYRYKKYSRIIPVRMTRPLARSVVMSGGETLEREMLEAGVESWPVEAELEVYELLPGGEVGHLAAFESADADEFEELTEEAATALAGDAELAGRGRPPGRSARRRFYRLRVPGARLRRRRRFSVRLDLSKPGPEIRLHLHLSERDAHRIATLLQRNQSVQVVAAIRKLADRGLRQALGARLGRMAARRRVALGAPAADALAQAITSAMVRAVSKQLPAAAGTLATAAQDPAAGATLTFGFGFADRDALAAGRPNPPSLAIRPGVYRE